MVTMARSARLLCVVGCWLCTLLGSPSLAAELPDVLRQGFVAGCGSCHTPGSKAPPLEQVLTTTVTPGFAEGSRLLEVLISRHGGADFAKARPDYWPDGETLAAVAAWIDRQQPDSEHGAATPPGRLTIVPDQHRYAPGDEVAFSVSATVDCHLTLISIDARGDALVLLPNDMERETRLSAGVPRRVPARDAAYRLKADAVGTERVVAWCTRDPRPLAGIRHAFGGHRFTLLGRWHEALAEMVGLSEEIDARPGQVARRAPGRGRERRPDWQSLFADHAFAAARFDVRARSD